MLKRIAYSGLSLLPGIALGAELSKPNIIYILLDDAGIGDFSCYGQQKFQTPNIDKLAKEGMLFTDHYSGSTVCAPSRAILLTGLHSGHSPVRGNAEVAPVGQKPMSADTVTFAKVLQDNGYATGAFGKWGLGHPGSVSTPLKMGFNRFFGYNCQRNAHSYYPAWLYDNDKKVDLDGKTYSATLIIDKALEWLRNEGSDKEKPFFCYLAITIPHAAMEAPEKDVAPWRKKFPQFEERKCRYGKSHTTNPAAQFAAMMTILDNEIGQVEDLIAELGIDDNTIIMITSDNGSHKEGGHMPEFFNSNGGLRGHKRDLYEGGVRTPFLVRWPGHIKAGSVTHLLSAHWDTFPTICEIAGIEPPENLDGISYLPTLLGKPEQKKHRYLYWEFLEQGGKRALRFGKNGEWKAVQLKMSSNPNANIALYNLKSDPHEDRNAAGEHPELIQTVKKAFASEHIMNPRFRFRFEKSIAK